MPFTHLYVHDIVSRFCFVSNGAHLRHFLCLQVIKTPPFGSRAESSLKGNLTALSDQVGLKAVRQGGRGEEVGGGRGERWRGGGDGEGREEGLGKEMTKRGSASRARGRGVGVGGTRRQRRQVHPEVMLYAFAMQCARQLADGAVAA